MLVGGAIAFGVYALDTPTALLLATPLGFGLGWAWPGLFNFSIVRNNPSAPAAATGVTQTGTYVGAMLGPLTFGWLAEHSGFGTAWLVGATWYLGAALAVVAGRAMMRRVKDARGIPAHEPMR
jgi:MFS family permease